LHETHQSRFIRERIFCPRRLRGENIGLLEELPMHASRFAVLCLTGAATIGLAGCAAKPKAPPAPASHVSVESARQSASELQAAYQKSNPSARVGVVLAAKPESGLVAVGNIPVKDFKPGDVFSFMDASQQIVANGRVSDIDGNLLVIKYDLLPSGGRAPRAGDLAIHLK
jgi:hypothetical protein